MTHPLTDEILEQFGMPDDLCVEGERVFFDDDMRAAADWQLEQVIKWFKESTSHYGGDCLYLYHLDLDEGIENVLRKAMRPTQEDNS